MDDPTYIRFRWSETGDLAGIRGVHREAFGGTVEADLATALLEGDVETLSLVAAMNGDIVGHILMSELGGAPGALALAPLGVAPALQGRGIGSELVRLGLLRATELDWRSVFVLGEPAYYTRFGFSTGLAVGANVAWAGPYFMALELKEGALSGFTGELRYAAPFSAL